MEQTIELPSPAKTILEFSPNREWNLPKRIAFRFVAAYFILFNLPYQGHVNVLGIVPGLSWISQAYIRGSRHAVEWVAAHVFHLTGSVAVYPQMNGSGDTTLDYIQQLMMVVLAAAATIVWSVLDRRRANYRMFHAWLRIFVRFTLAMTMFGYGFAKVFPLQFSPPTLIRLLEPLNEFSPMGVLWTFMGASAAYTIFAGSAEVLGGLLLIPRRTTALGALVTAGVMTNVVLLNFCYDVPVKLYSSNLLLMAIFLAAPEFKRLFDLFVMNRATRPSRVDDPLFRSRNLRGAAIAMKTLLFGYVLYTEIKGGVESYRRFYTNAPKSPLYGIWNVARIDGARWNKVVMERPQAMSIRRDDGAPTGFQTTFDEARRRITLTNAGYLDYAKSGNDALHMEGVVQNQRVSMDLTRVDLSKFLLTNRGFHWINERPFNR